MDYLVGSSGFVGSNLCQNWQFAGLFNSKNIQEAYHQQPDLLVYAGVRAEKYLANQYPNDDQAHVQTAIKNISEISPRQLVLISTIDVYPQPVEVDEFSEINSSMADGYGRHRRHLEEWVQTNFPTALIVRLPALFGGGLKKNFLYDLKNPVPKMLKIKILEQLSANDPEISNYYLPIDQQFAKLTVSTKSQLTNLRQRLECQGFSARNFTNNQSQFQFYPLSLLADHLRQGLTLKLPILNLNSQPLSAQAVDTLLNPGSKPNQQTTQSAAIVRYDVWTRHATKFGGSEKYLLTSKMIEKYLKNWWQQTKN